MFTVAKIGGVAAVAALGLVACGHHKPHTVEPTVVEKVITEKPVIVEEKTIDCAKTEHKVYKECVGS